MSTGGNANSKIFYKAAQKAGGVCKNKRREFAGMFGNSCSLWRSEWRPGHKLRPPRKEGESAHSPTGHTFKDGEYAQEDPSATDVATVSEQNRSQGSLPKGLSIPGHLCAFHHRPEQR